MNEQHEEGGQESGQTGTGPAILTTGRLILRGPRAEDARTIAGLANNRRIAEQTRRMPHPYGVEDALRWIEMTGAGDESAFLVTRKADNAILGAAGCGAMDDKDKEIGYWIGEPYWGNGFATEAVQAVIDHIFADQPLERLYGRCRVSNASSRRVLMKCGFQLAGAGMCDSAVLSGLVPVEEFALERSVWESLKRWGAK